MHLDVPMGIEELWDAQFITFDIGHTIGNFIVTKVKENDGRVYGHWGCRCKSGLLFGPTLYHEAKEHSCNVCQQPYDNYLEFHLSHDALLLQGHCDLAVEWNDSLYLTEVKSVNENGATTISERGSANLDHVIQLLFYWWMAKEKGYPVHDFGSVLYVRKEWMVGNPYLEFVVDFLDMEHTLLPYLEEARGYARNILRGAPLPDRVCDSIDVKKAEDCPFTFECFANET